MSFVGSGVFPNFVGIEVEDVVEALDIVGITTAVS